MTTQKRPSFRGVTELRTTLHGALKAAQEREELEAFAAEYVREVVEATRYPVDFYGVLDQYGIKGEEETAFLFAIASLPGGAELFLTTVISATALVRGSVAISLRILEGVVDRVMDEAHQNAPGSTNATPSTPRKGWVRFNVSNAHSNEFKRGMGEQEGGVHHGR